MVESDYIFESGEPITVGATGENDILFASGDSVTDAGASGYVFEQGNGIRGGLFGDDFEDGDVSEYKGDTDALSVVTDSLNGQYSGKVFVGDNNANVVYNDTVVRGPPLTVEWLVEARGQTHGESYLYLGADSSSGWGLEIDVEGNRINITQNKDNQITDTINNITLDKNVTYRGRLTWKETGEIQGEVFNEKGNRIAHTRFYSADFTTPGGFAIGYNIGGDTGQGYAVFDDIKVV